MKKICIVDDDQELAQFLTEILTEDGYEVEQYESAMFIDVFKEKNFDLIVLDGWFDDMMMGPQLATALKADASLASVPILAISSDPHVKERFSGVSAHFLPKPFNPEVFLETVATLTNR